VTERGDLPDADGTHNKPFHLPADRAPYGRVSPPLVNASVDMTSAVKGHVTARIADSVPSSVRALPFR